MLTPKIYRLVLCLMLVMYMLCIVLVAWTILLNTNHDACAGETSLCLNNSTRTVPGKPTFCAPRLQYKKFDSPRDGRALEPNVSLYIGTWLENGCPVLYFSNDPYTTMAEMFSLLPTEYKTSTCVQKVP